MKILLVDDDELDRKSILRAISKSDLKCDVYQASTAAEALTSVAENHYDAILLDFRLPDQNGIEVLRLLRSGKYAAIAIIMLSGVASSSVAEQCFEAGAQDYLLKDEVSSIRLTRAVIQAKQRYVIEQELRNSHEKLRNLSEHDPLTGLYNRRGFQKALEHAIDSAKREQMNTAVILLDLDGFKSINDTLGHDIGDLLLQRVAKRFKSVMRDTDYLCRLGGDEFVVLLKGLVQEQDAVCLVNRIFHLLKLPMQIGGESLQVTASIGIAVFSDLNDQGDDLLKCADVAMYQAKKNGRNQSCFYNRFLQELVEKSVKIKTELKNAITNDEFKVFFQAQISASGGELKGIEALMRWQHPELGLLTPDKFLLVAEKSELMIEIGTLMLQKACRQLKNWKDKYSYQFPNLSMAVNLSAIQIWQENLLDVVMSSLSSNALDADSLKLEITESALIQDLNNSAAILESLAAKGVKFSLDDFGTGYSSLNHLKLLPISMIKLDKSLVSEIGSGGQNEKLLVAMMVFAKILNLKIVAEGVETKNQAEFCRQNGCDLLQGYYFSEPISASDFEARFLFEKECSSINYGQDA